MVKVTVIPMALLWIYWLAGPMCLLAQNLSDEVREFLRNRIEAAGLPAKITVGQQLIHASVVLPHFYERRAYRPAWSDDDGLLPQAYDLIRSIQQADQEGLRPGDYHLNSIEPAVKEIGQNQSNRGTLDPRRLVDLDLLLTDAFLIYGAHLLAGKVNPETFDREWHANRRESDIAGVLSTALDSNQIRRSLKSLLPPQSGYAKLARALAQYRRITAEGGWSPVPDGPKLQKGDNGERVLALRQRIIISGDLPHETHGDGSLFDEGLEQAVRRFQGRHGLDVDGAVGPDTLAALNVPVEDRIRQIELNMERWRWLPQDLGKRHILVNIANFELEVFEEDQRVMVIRVVVGKGYRRTPVFSDKMTYVVMCPYWHIPQNIAVQDKLPLIQKNPNYLVQQRMKVFEGWGSDAREVDPKTIDWSRVTEKNFTFRLRQDPGPWNALGRVKFMFPNKFNVYLHDTPSQELFSKTTRAFSSGCIRLERPIDLAEYVLRGNLNWGRERILAAIGKNVEQTVPLPEPIPVHVLYWTAWVGEDRAVHFRSDIYGRDNLLDKALSEEPPRSE